MKTYSSSPRYFKLLFLMNLMFFHHVPCIFNYELDSSTNIVLTRMSLMPYYEKETLSTLSSYMLEARLFPSSTSLWSIFSALLEAFNMDKY